MAYLPTCPYCFSHYVAALFVALLRFKIRDLRWAENVRFALKVATAAAGMVAVLGVTRGPVGGWVAAPDGAGALFRAAGQGLHIGVCAGLGFAVFGIAAWALRIDEVRMLRAAAGALAGWLRGRRAKRPRGAARP